ncbi:MAG: formyl transferase [Denitrovibrio sp.]|nr:MAG: formyl transferase [Denitrovibrio sp.]
MSIVLFTANKLGEMLLEELTKRSFFPEVVTYTRGFQRTTQAKDLGSFRRDFSMSFIASNNIEDCDNLPEITGKTVVCVDWTKDFFKGSGLDVVFAHPSLLPLYRGYSALTEQFVRGVAVSGATFYMQGEKIDGGDIVAQKEIRIQYEDYPLDFMQRYVEVCADFIIELNRKGLQSYTPMPQNEDEAFYLQRKRGKDSIIDFNRDAYNIYNHIRGYSRPFFGAFFMKDGQRVTVWHASTEVWQGEYGTPGSVLSVSDNGAELACGSGTIILREIEVDGKIYKGD